MSAIFISHSSKDNKVAKEVKRRLQKEGHRSLFLDFDPSVGIPAGRAWEPELYAQLRACQAFIVLCSEHSMKSDWCFEEIITAKALGKPIFPIKVSDCRLRSVLLAKQVIDLRSDEEEAYGRLWRGLKIAGLDPASSFDWDSSRPPYPGLPAFQKEDAAIFFGRSKEVGDSLEKLRLLRTRRRACWLIVLGTSGTGKSSLVRAGVIPRLELNRGEWVVVPPFCPGTAPLKELAQVLALASSGTNSGVKVGAEEILAKLSNGGPEASPGAVLNRIAEELKEASQKKASVLLVIDQSEEMLGDEAGDANTAFLGLIADALRAPDSPLMVLSTLRADFLGDFQQRTAAFDFDIEQVPLKPISRDGLIEVIEKPAKLAGIELETRLVAAMVRDAEASKEALPLLAFTLRELYERFASDGLLTLKEYQELGRLEGSIARVADGLVENNEDLLDDLRSAFISMAQMNEEEKFVRRFVPWSLIPTNVHGVMERFLECRLLLPRQEEGEQTLGVAHEALFGSWKLLEGWLQKEKDYFRWRRRLREAHREWKRTKDPSELWSRRALKEANEYRQRESLLEEEEREFIRESQEHVSQIRRTKLAVGLSIPVVAILAAILVYILIPPPLYLVPPATEMLEVDPTEAALILLEIEKPAETPFAMARMHDVLSKGLAEYEFGVDQEIVSGSYSPGGSQFVTASLDGTVRLWKPGEPGKPVEIPNDDALLQTPSFSRRGDRLATVTESGLARLWNADGSGGPIDLDHSPVVTASFSAKPPDRLVTVADDGTVKLWTIDGTSAGELVEAHDTFDASFAPDGDHLVTLSREGIARSWRLSSPDQQGSIQFQLIKQVSAQDDRFSSVAFSPRGDRLVTFSSRPSVKLQLVGLDSDLLIELKGHTGGVATAEFSRKGDRVVTASDDGTALLWNSRTGQQIEELKPGEGWVDSASFSPDGSRLVTVSGKNARVWRIGAGGPRPIAELRGHSERISFASFSPGGDRIVTGFADGTARVWRIDRHDALARHPAGLTYAGFTSDGQSVLTASKDGTLKQWDIQGKSSSLVNNYQEEVLSVWIAPGQATTRAVTVSDDGAVNLWTTPSAGQSPNRRQLDTLQVSAASFSPNGDWLVTCGKDSLAQIWATDGTADPVGLKGHKDPVLNAAFSPDSERVVTASADNTARVWNLNGELLKELKGKHSSDVEFAAFSPDGKLIVTASWDGRALLWSTEEGSLLGPLFDEVPEAELVFAAFSPSGDRVAIGLDNGSVWMRRTDRAGDTIQLKEHSDRITSMSFHPDGGQLATGSEDGTARIWPVGVESLRKALQDATKVCLDANRREEILQESPDDARQKLEECRLRNQSPNTASAPN